MRQNKNIQRIVVKVGTQSILTEDGLPLSHVLISLVEQLSLLHKQGYQLILVSSGAVSFGRQITGNILSKFDDVLGGRQLLAALGQPQLMAVYADLFKKHNLLVAQLLLTKQDFHTRKHYLNIARLLRETLKHKNIIPIINENDSVAIEELMFTDNDELAGLIATQVNADKLIILSSVDGVYSKDPKDPEAKLIPVLDVNSNWPIISTTKTKYGRGGMISKLATAYNMANLGITTHITNINQDNILLRLMNNELLGTIILANKKKSNIKKWLFYNLTKQEGSIVINNDLAKILQEATKIISILPVGIIDFSGKFKKGDVIDIYNSYKQKIGIGLAKYDANTLKNYLGLQNKPEFIHYDKLHIFLTPLLSS